ncbi:MAG: alr0857 family protein [Coleofasciculaceae cyanobacterium]
MLKLTYTENSFCLEHLTGSVEEWVTSRVILVMRVGAKLCIQPSTASFLLPADLPHLADLQAVVEQEHSEQLELSLCDAEYVEVSLRGTWLVSEPESEEGVLVTAMSYRVEFFLMRLWQEAQAKTSVVWE